MSADDGDKLKVVPLAKAPSAAEAAGDYLRRDMHVLLENQKTIAQLRRAAYLAYLKEGFNEQQALELCAK